MGEFGFFPQAVSLGVGVTMRPLEASGAFQNAGHLRGMKLRDLAMWVRSWNEYETAMEFAAINSALNAPQILRQNCGELVDESQNQDVFTCMRRPDERQAGCGYRAFSRSGALRGNLRSIDLGA
jgi:hypothetical protein